MKAYYLSKNTNINAIIKEINSNQSSHISLNYKEGKWRVVPIKVFCDIIERTSLTDLKLTHNWFNSKEIRQIAEVLKVNVNLTGLNLSYNNISDKGVKYIAEIFKSDTNINTLQLEMCSINKEGIRDLVEALKANMSLTELNLSINKIGNEGVKYIAELLENNTKITKLVLEGGSIYIKGIKYISEALKVNTSLTELNLSSNDVSLEGVKYIAEALKANMSLTELDLSGSKIGDEGAKSIAKALKTNMSLNGLNLSFNEISVEGVKSIAEALKTNMSLNGLNLSFNEISVEGVKSIIDSMKYNFTIMKLDINGITDLQQKIVVDYQNRNKEYTSSLADFIFENNKEISKGYYGDFRKLIVKKLPPFSTKFNPQTEKLIAPDGVLSFFVLFNKVSMSVLKECLNQNFLKIGINKEEEKSDYIINNFKNLQAANYFLFNRICKDSINDFREEEKTLNNIFNILPKEILVDNIVNKLSDLSHSMLDHLGILGNQQAESVDDGYPNI